MPQRALTLAQWRRGHRTLAAYRETVLGWARMGKYQDVIEYLKARE